MVRIILHIDLNAFFAEAELLRHEEFRNSPVAIASKDKRSVVSTSNYIARKYGVKSGLPLFMAKEKCPNLVIIEPDFFYYDMLSTSFFSILSRYSNLVEPLSIDEGFVDLTDKYIGVNDPYPLLKEIQNTIYEELGLPSSLGLGPTKFLAKMASDIQKPMGITIIRRKDIKDIIYPLEISSFYGIGTKTTEKLKKIGIYTINDLATHIEYDDPNLHSIFGSYYDVIKTHINGYGDDIVRSSRSDPKSVSRGHTLSNITRNYDEIRDYIEYLLSDLMNELKEYRLYPLTVEVSIKDPEFRKVSKSYTFKNSIDNKAILLDKALTLYENNFLNKDIRFISVTLSNLVNPVHEEIQMNFWNYQEYEEKDSTKLLINDFNKSLRKRYKKELLCRGSDVKDNDN